MFEPLEGALLHVADGRKAESLGAYCDTMTPAQRERFTAVSMDMWAPFTSVTEDRLPGALIAFDKFHIARHLVEAVDKVRRQEHRELLGTGNRRLIGTKYFWTSNEENLDSLQRAAFASLKDSNLRVARACALKETARYLWDYSNSAVALKAWLRRISWALRCRLPPMVAAGKMVKKHLAGIINAVISGITNAVAEGTNSKIQTQKLRACGFRNRERFKRVLYFHLGWIDLYPTHAS